MTIPNLRLLLLKSFMGKVCQTQCISQQSTLSGRSNPLTPPSTHTQHIQHTLTLTLHLKPHLLR